MGEKHRGTRRALCVLLAALALACAPGLVSAEQNGVPSGAVISPVTPKPWLVPMKTDEPSAESAAAPQTPTQTLPPSSLDVIKSREQTAQPTAMPESTSAPDGLPAELGLTDPDVFRVLLIGTDSYTKKQRGRSDTMLLVQLNVATGQVKLVSFLRDLFVKIPGYSKTRLNAAYVYGGAELLETTLYNNFGVTADAYAAVSFPTMVRVIDRIGGVTVEVSEKERVQLNSILKYYNAQNGYAQRDQLLAEPGLQTLTGKQALCFSRIRKIDSDFKRVNRQQKVIEAIFERLRSMDALSLSAAALETLADVRTDLTLEEITALLPMVSNLNGLTWDSLTVPVNSGFQEQTVAGMDVLVPNLERNRNTIADFLQ